MKCPSCGAVAAEGKRFCVHCGAALPPPRCPACGAATPAGARFCGDCGAKLTADVSRAPEESVPAPLKPPPAEAERRQLTVMFCDLVDSTALSAGMDPEDLREVIRAYHACAAEVIGRFEGHVAKYMGDGVLTYFGYPQAHEDDAERAVRAGLELVQVVGRLAPQPGLVLQVRVGIATGVVVVGDLIGEGAAREEAVVGETPNLAARLQALAEPGTVVIASGTRRLLGGLFDLADLGPQPLKGFAVPVRAWAVLGPSAAEGRFEARHVAGLTPLVGREEELALLLRRWVQAKEGEGQVVLLTGEAGIGKSRLLRALRERLADEPHTSLSHFGSPYHAHSALHPVIGLLERAAGLARDDPPERRLDKLEVMLALATEDVREVAPLLAGLLMIPTGARYPPLDHLSPQQKKERTFQALVDQLAGLASRQPVLALWEDVHWIDPTSLELLGLAVDRAQGLPVLVVITFRPEFVPPWMGHGHVTALSLGRLGRWQGAALVERVTGGKALPGEVVEQIIAKTDGVPLFVEELTKAVLESGLLSEEGGRYALAGQLPPLAIPATLHDSLTARLDRLGPAKEVAQIGATIGREFAHELLAAVAPLDHASLEAALDRLVAAELIFRRGAPPRASYVFKHALVQDVAYESLLKSRRQQLHGRIVQALEERFLETAEAEPDLLAHHCARAGLIEKAVIYRYRAGQRAIARSALEEAVAQLRQGLEALAGLPDSPERRRRELDLQAALGGALVAARGYGAEETGAAFARARELCQEAGESRRLLPVLNGQLMFHNVRGELLASRETAVRMLELAHREGDPALLIPAHRAMSSSSLTRGRFAAAREHAEQVLALYEPERHRTLGPVYAFDQRVVVLSYLGPAEFALGYPDRGRRRSDEAWAEARRLDHPNSLAHAQWFACVLREMVGDAEGLAEAAEALAALAAEHGLPYFAATGSLVRGRVLIHQGKAEEALVELDRGLAAARAAGTRFIMANVTGMVADAYLLAGRRREALNVAAEALASMERGNAIWFEADQYRQIGELLLSPPEPDEAKAEACFRRAIRIARAQDARTLELRAATSLARLWRDQGKPTEARELLAPVYGWFTEGFDTPDLRDAKALLDRLR